MKIIHISTGYNHGGAAIACKRLVEAQRDNGIDAEILTQEQGIFPEYVHSTTNSKLREKLNLFRLAWEKFIYLFHQSSGSYRFQYSLANSGQNISKNKLLLEADIIHLHWINGGFISMSNIKKILALGKPVVWTLHDIWPLTGGCHITANCEEYKKHCTNCFYLNRSTDSLSKRQLAEKREIFDSQIHFVAPSQWQLNRAKLSFVFGENKITRIANPINQNTYRLDKIKCRQKLVLDVNSKVILFGAFNVVAEHKGMLYLLDALTKLPQNKNMELVVFGKKSELFEQLQYKVHYLGYISDEREMMEAYCAADLFVSPSIEDNLPNTILESFSLATPVAAFNTGGIPDIIDHKINGYLAEYKNADDLAKGIMWCLENNKEGELGENASKKISSHFTPKKIASEFKKFYTNLLDNA